MHSKEFEAALAEYYKAKCILMERTALGFLAYEEGDTYRASFQDDGTYLEARCGQPVVYLSEPTFWMPLPQPPEEEND